MALPIQRNWMLFVDGENFTMRAQKIAENTGLRLIQGDFYEKDTFVWIPGMHRATNCALIDSVDAPMRGHNNAVRAHYYTSVCGSEEKVDDIAGRLWHLGFSPNVFKKEKQQEKAKGVDIALTKDMLSHAYQGNYEFAVLVSGDGDYVPLVEEVKRLGKSVFVVAFAKSGLSDKLRRASDYFVDCESLFIEKWGALQGAASN